LLGALAAGRAGKSTRVAAPMANKLMRRLSVSAGEEEDGAFPTVAPPHFK